MMSSSELQRISLSATKIVSLEGTVDLEQLNEQDETVVDNDDENSTTADVCTEDSTKPLTLPVETFANVSVNGQPASAENLTNGVDASPNAGNETITSSMGDVTVDSVRDHLNSTVTTLHSTTTEEIVGKLLCDIYIFLNVRKRTIQMYVKYRRRFYTFCCLCFL